MNKNGLKLNAAGVENINQQFPLVHRDGPVANRVRDEFQLRDSTGVEFNVNIPIVQAPFRIYWAYNPLRIHQTLVAPFDQINLHNLAVARRWG